MTVLRIEPSEQAIQSDVRLVLGLDPDVVLWRNSVGSPPRATVHVRYGVCVESSVLIGIVTASFDCIHIGRFLALEIKRPDARPTKDQISFLRLVQSRGGVAAVISSPSQAVALVAQAKADPTYRGGDLS